MRRKWQGSWLAKQVVRAARRAGRRGAFLTFLTILNLLYGYSLLTAPVAQRGADLLLPWTAWGWAWVAMGFVTGSGIFARRDRIQFGASATFKTAWGVVQMDLWLAHGVQRAWVGGVIFLSLAATVLVVAGWPEPGRVVQVPAPPGLTQGESPR